MPAKQEDVDCPVSQEVVKDYQGTQSNLRLLSAGDPQQYRGLYCDKPPLYHYMLSQNDALLLQALYQCDVWWSDYSETSHWAAGPAGADCTAALAAYNGPPDTPRCAVMLRLPC